MTTCEQYRALMFEYVQGDLQSLERTRIETHLANCDRCSALSSTIREGIKSARAWAPTVEKEHLDRLIHRLSPYMNSGRGSRAPLWGGLAFAAMAAAIALAFITPEGPSTKSSPTPVVVATPDELPVDPPRRSRLAPNLRVVSSGDWDGRVASQGDAQLKVEMSKGFAVLAFEKLGDEPLEIQAQGLEVKAHGTVFVEVVEEGLTTVGVV